MSFLKKLLIDLPTKRLIFKPKQGIILSHRIQEDLTFLTIRDPFIGRFNWAYGYKDKAKIERFIEAIWALFDSAAKATEIRKVILNEGGGETSNDSGTGSGSKDKSLSSYSSEIHRERAQSDVTHVAKLQVD